MSFPRYPKYKDSGVEWLGQVPEHWDVKRLRFVAELNPSKSEVNNLSRDTSISFLPMDAIGDAGTLRLDQEKAISEVESGYTYFRDGDVTVAKITPCYENGKGALMRGLVNGIGFGTTELIVARPKLDEITGTYLHYLFISPDFRSIGESHMYGAGGQKRVPDAFVRNFATAFPPVHEQIRIAAFLDRETAKIDALVAEQERLMELLKEKRQAVISHAVTKGLNPKAAMKSSGIEWLGDVPAHWAVPAFNYRYEVELGKMLDEKRITGNHLAPYLRNTDVQWGRINVEGLPQMDFTGADLNRYGLRVGDLLVCEGGEVGRAAIWNGELENCFYQKALHRIRPRDANRDSAKFLYFIFQAAAATGVFAGTGGKSTIAHLPAEALRRYRFAFPPLSEQLEIASFLDRESVRFDTLTAEAQRAIDLLQERRTAVISAAVTGQIDVRQFSKKEAS